MTRNRLGDETSPYLLQHADNPVHWWPWGDAALAEAQRLDRPILLSVGYAACHWCHVMAHESFEDDETAALMNRLFVNIKVDREERPDIDTIYMSSLHLLGEHGGWPLTMFLTPAGEPFWGGTYFPPTPRYGRPGFPQVLETIARIYAEERDKVTGNVESLREGLAKLSTTSQGGAIAVATLDQVAEQLTRSFDSVNGGIGGAPKFPQCGIFELVWRAALRHAGTPRGDTFGRAITTTLTRICQGGIYDHLGGGFARYATDEAWLVPHFEKMLYDTAELIDLLTLVWQRTRDPLHEQRVHETIDWALREMRGEGDAFASSFDADSEGEEGKFYVWTETEIDALLGADATLFKQAYDVRPEGNWEGHTILNRNRAPELRGPDDEALLARCRAVLFETRARRVPPGRDDKILADWNGLMIAALARAGACFERPGWIAAATRAFDFVTTAMVADGRLKHSYRLGRAQHAATLDDYANLARAALALHEATGEPRFVDHATGALAVLDRHYWDAAGGGYFFSADDTTGLITRTKTASDNAVPSGNGTVVGVLARLHLLTGDARWRERADQVIAAFSGELGRNFFPLSTLLNNAELLARGVQVVVVGRRDEAAVQALLRAARRSGLATQILTVIEDGAALPAGHPAHGKTRVDGRPAAYVCVGPTCTLPLTEPDALAAALRRSAPSAP
ncbi:MAG TPA: thioredoxin domain-containing protein [Candidatus Sulfotelmatobacter sp.]|nr:thioredoxin domain-containing protein [Candidatus Sulfotelmatobacter sp.]